MLSEKKKINIAKKRKSSEVKKNKTAKKYSLWSRRKRIPIPLQLLVWVLAWKWQWNVRQQKKKTNYKRYLWVVDWYSFCWMHTLYFVSPTHKPNREKCIKKKSKMKKEIKWEYHYMVLQSTWDNINFLQFVYKYVHKVGQLVNWKISFH